MNDVTVLPPNPSGMLDETRALVRQEARHVSPVLSIKLTSIGEIMQFAEHAGRSQLVPETYRGKPADIVIAVMQGAELGLPPIQALNSIAVINGRPSVWGDAVPGLCYASGKVEDISEHFEGSPGTDGYTAVCVAKRRGVPSPKVGRFSVADAKTAGLHGKATHGKYPGRMMMWRARHFALHDAFPDVLRGIGTRELDAEDAMANAGPSWSTPMPEKSKSETALRNQDGWDNTWFLGVEGKLLSEPNAWKWMDILFAALREAPTKRDLDELCDLDAVFNARAKAPEEAKQKIDTAINEAAERFKHDKQAKPEEKPETKTEQPKTEKPQAPERDYDGEFEAVLIDRFGEILGEHSDPREFAGSFMQLWHKAKEDEDREALLEHNGDSIDEAKALSPAASEILSALDDVGQKEEVSLSVLEVPEVAGKPSWPAYVKAFKDTLKTIGNDVYDWLNVQRPTLERCPTAQRAILIKAIAVAAADEQPAWLGDLVRPKKATEGAKTEAKKAEPQAEEKSQTADERWAENTINEVNSITDRNTFDAYVRTTVMRTIMARLRRENIDLFNKVDAVVAARLDNFGKGA